MARFKIGSGKGLSTEDIPLIDSAGSFSESKADLGDDIFAALNEGEGSSAFLHRISRMNPSSFCSTSEKELLTSEKQRIFSQTCD